MARRPRPDFSGATYHVINRFVDKHPFFRHEVDFRFFLRVYFETAAAFGIRTFSYCLMPNHFHFVLETPDGGISEFLRRFLTRVAVEMNRRCERTGHLFQGRSKTLLVETELYFETVNAYVLLNPVRAGICSDPLAYPWSSGRDILAMASRVDLRTLAERVAGRDLGSLPEVWRAALLDWVYAVRMEENERKFRDGHRGQYLASAQFRKAMIELRERPRAPAVVQPVAAETPARRFSDRPQDTWTWEEMRSLADRAVDGDAARLAGWRNRENAVHEATCWLAHERAGWSFQRLISADGRRSEISRYSMIMSRIRVDERRMRLMEKLAMRVKGACHAQLHIC